MYYGMYLNSKNLTINNFVINDNNGIPLNKGLILDDVGKAVVNNLTVNNSMVCLYVHRSEDNFINSNVEINNSNLLNNICSSFNVLDNNVLGSMIVNNEYKGLIADNFLYSLNKNYQVIFNGGNKLNCVVASGSDTNTYVSVDNTRNKELASYTYDEINYDNLTDTTQNVNNGTVDVVRKYKGVTTIEEGSSVDDDIAFTKEMDLSGNTTCASEDDTITKIENGKILGIKEGITTIKGVRDGGTTYEIEVIVIKNPKTNSIIYVGIGIILILILSTVLYSVYRIKLIVNND